MIQKNTEKIFCVFCMWTFVYVCGIIKKRKNYFRNWRENRTKRELGIARCGLACCLCSENDKCNGCKSDNCPDKDWCENRKCSISKNIEYCYKCEENCNKGLLDKIKPYAFTLFAKRYGEKELLDCLERNEKKGVVYHRKGIIGDYDDFNDAEKLIEFIRTGEK